MNEPIELAIESPDGIIDCRLEPQSNEDELSYSVTVLYPQIVNGYNRSEIYCHIMLRDDENGNFFFDAGEEIHPKIKALEMKLSMAIAHGK